MPKKTTRKRTQVKESLRSFLDAVLLRARKNTHHGDSRSKDLANDLLRIEARVQETLEAINKEAKHSDSPNDEARVLLKLDKTTQLLTNEMMQLAAVYHRQKDVTLIRRFLNEQHEIIRQSVAHSDSTDDTNTKSLDGRIAELHRLMYDERERVGSATHRERVKFLLSITVGLLSLVISVYALLYK